MKTTIELDKKLHNSNNSIQELLDKCARQEQQIEELSAKLKWYEEQHRLAQQKRFGTSSEKTDEQLSIFNEAETITDAKAIEPTVEEITYKRKKAKGSREETFKDLPVETIEYRLEELDCPACDNQLHEMSKEIRKELKIIPAQVKVVEHVRYTYACRSCEKNETTTPIITAPMPAPVIPKSLVSPSLLAFIMNRKYAEAIPLYRQEQQFKHFGIELSRQNLANWIVRGSNDWLASLYNRMHQKLVEHDILHADETTLQVLQEQGRKATSKSYMWLYATGHTDTPIYLYDYQTTRASKHPQRMLKDFNGFLHADGYAGYNDIKGVTVVGCIAHARRKFKDALKALPAGTPTIGSTAQEGLDYINKLFVIESKLSDEAPDKRHKLRQEQSKPVLDAFSAWLLSKKKQVLPKSSLGQAITYCLNQWDKLVVYLQDGRLEISNNRGERAIKPFVIGRKNWLFNNSPKGATASAIIYSVIETAKANNLSPFQYLQYLFEKLPNIDVEDTDQIDQLLPWSNHLPDVCKTPKKE